jgi:hypothetical protein
MSSAFAHLALSILICGTKDNLLSEIAPKIKFFYYFDWGSI